MLFAEEVDSIVPVYLISQPDQKTREYTWEAYGRTWAVKVWEDSSFLAPSILVREEAQTSSRVTSPARNHAHCFMKGVLRDASESAVAVNICGGLVSIFIN